MRWFCDYISSHSLSQFWTEKPFMMSSAKEQSLIGYSVIAATFKNYRKRTIV